MEHRAARTEELQRNFPRFNGLKRLESLGRDVHDLVFEFLGWRRFTPVEFCQRMLFPPVFPLLKVSVSFAPEQVQELIFMISANSKELKGLELLDMVDGEILASGLRDNSCIEELELTCTACDDFKMSKVISSLNVGALRRLSLRGNNRVAELAANLLCLFLHSSRVLEELDLSACQISNKAFQVFSLALREYKGLKKFWIGENCLTDDAIPHFVNLLERGSNLITFHADRNNFGPLGIRALLSCSSSLREMRIEENRGFLLSAPEKQQTSSLHRSLENVDISRNYVPEALDLFLTRNRVQKLSAGNCELNLTRIHLQLRESSVADLDISGNTFELKSAQRLGSALLENATLKKLNLAACELSREMLRDIMQGIRGNSSLEQLDLASNKITALSEGTIGTALMHNRCLKRLNLSFNEISGVLLAPLLRECQALEELLLVHNKIDDQTGAVFAENGSHLKKINMARNHLAEESAIAFEALIRESKMLENLNLSYNRFDAASTALAAAIVVSKSLRVFELHEDTLRMGLVKQFEKVWEEKKNQMSRLLVLSKAGSVVRAHRPSREHAW